MNTISHRKIDQEHNEIDLSALLNQLIENKLLVLIITSIFLLLGILYASMQTPQYRANVLIQAEDKHGDSNLLGALTSQIQLGGAKGNVSATQTALIKSRFILGPVGQTLGLDINARLKQTILQRLFFPIKSKIKVTIFTLPLQNVNKTFQLIYDKPNHVTLYNSKNEVLLEGPIGKLLTNKNKTSQLQIVSLTAPLGTTFLLTKNSVARTVSQLISKININDLDRKNNIGILDISVRNESSVLATRIANEIAYVTVRKNAEKKSLEASKSLEFLHYQLPIVKQSLEAAEVKLNRYRAQSGKLDIKLQTENFLRQLAELDKKLAELRINKIDMLQRYTTAHPAFIALSRQIKEIKQDKKNLEYKLKTIPEADQIAVNLMLDVQIKTALYTTLLNKIQELEVIKAGTISDVQILSSAKLPDEPLPSKKKLIYLGSILLGLISSFMLIFVRKLLFIRITDPHWTEPHYNIMNLAIIPYSKEQHENTHRLTAKKTPLPLLAQINPRSLAIESLRSLRTNLQITLTCASNNVISILGISPWVGKTFVSTNLAYLLATTGKRVLIIDADLRRGTIHKYFNQTAALGFSELISGTKEIIEVLKPTSHSNLTVLTRGDYPIDPSELLTSTRCKELITDFSKQFDVVIIDTAPVLLVTDAVVVSAISATNYLVLGSNIHQPSEIEIVIKRLTNAGITLNGSIFNFHNSASCKTSYYSKYYGYQSYYEDETKEQQKKKKKGIEVQTARNVQ